MVNNSTNIIKKTITFHLNSLNTRKDHIVRPDPGIGQAQTCGRLNWFMGSQPS